MIIDENAVRGCVATQGRRKKVDHRDEVTVMTVVTHTYIQLWENARHQWISDHLKVRVLDTVRLIEKVLLAPDPPILAPELVMMLKKIVRILGMTDVIDSYIPIDYGDDILPEYEAGVVGEAFSYEEAKFIATTLMGGCLICMQLRTAYNLAVLERLERQ